MLHLVIQAFANNNPELDVAFVTLPINRDTIRELHNLRHARAAAQGSLPVNTLVNITVEWPPCQWWSDAAYAPAQDLLYPITSNWPVGGWLICDLNPEHLAALAGIDDNAEDADYPDANDNRLVYLADGDMRLEAKTDNSDTDGPNLVSQWIDLDDIAAAYENAKEIQNLP